MQLQEKGAQSFLASNCPKDSKSVHFKTSATCLLFLFAPAATDKAKHQCSQQLMSVSGLMFLHPINDKQQTV